MKIIKVKTTKKDAGEVFDPHSPDVKKFMDKLNNSNRNFGGSDLFIKVNFQPDFVSRKVIAEISGPAGSFKISPSDISGAKKFLSIVENLKAATNSAIQYADKKQKELEKEFKVLWKDAK